MGGVYLGIRYCNLLLRNFISSNERPVRAGVYDSSRFYHTKLKNKKLKQYNYKLAMGAVKSNIGEKITDTDQNDRDFIPTNLRVGGD